MNLVDGSIPAFDNINASNPGINFCRRTRLQNPGTATAATARRLGSGYNKGATLGALVCEALGLFICAVDRFQFVKGETFGKTDRTQCHSYIPNSDAAATAALSISGFGKKTKARMMIVATAMMTFISVPLRSKPSTGSSKYMTLMIRR